MHITLLGGNNTLTYNKICSLDTFKVPVGKIWNSEEKDFTPWLSENLDVISELTHLNLYYDSVECEKRIGRYEADIVVKDLSTGSIVVIENQYGQSDHKHLGQCLTYKANTDADIVIWISEHFTEEHLNAIKSLNDDTADKHLFFAIRIEAYKIGERGFYHFVVEESPRTKKFDPDNKNFIFWHELTKQLAPTDLKDKISPWGRAYIDIKLEKCLFLTLSITNNISKVSIWTKEPNKAKELAQKFTANPLGLCPTEGVKNPNYRGWRFEKEGRDLVWMAEKAIKLYSYYKQNY